MNVTKREIRLHCDAVAAVPFFERIILVNQHDISLRTYADGREECIVNGLVYAADTLDMIQADMGSANASKAFHQLTGLWVAEWDRAYRRLWWSQYMDGTAAWYGIWWCQWPAR